MATTAERWRSKADAFVDGWRAEYGGETPPLHAVILGLSVAQHETHCGDSWPGPDGLVGTEDDENNWGATTLRALNAAERAVLAKAGLAPTVGPGHNERAKAAMDALRASGLPLPQGVIHCDSSPRLGPYFVFFASFPTPWEGARYFVHLLCGSGGKRPAHAVLLDPAGTEQQLADAMYRAGYYTGFNDPKQPGGAQKNVDAYAGSLRAISPGVRAGLAGWTPKAPAAPATPPAPVVVEVAPTSIGPEDATPPTGTHVSVTTPVAETPVAIVPAPAATGWAKLLAWVVELLRRLLARPR